MQCVQWEHNTCKLACKRAQHAREHSMHASKAHENKAHGSKAHERKALKHHSQAAQECSVDSLAVHNIVDSQAP